jgi:LmbE family N-acetylglucosaminyl deacetylase
MTSLPTTVPGLDAVAGLGTVVAVFAHPDDESYLAGGLMAAASGRGQRVVCVTATAGGDGGDPAVRAAELDAALAALGGIERLLLDLPDGGCRLLGDDPVELLADVLAEVSPDTVVTFDDDGHTGHPDHMAVARWTVAASRRSSPSARILQTAWTETAQRATPAGIDHDAIFEPGLPVLVAEDDLALDLRLDGDVLDRKVAAVAAHASQTAGLIDQVGLEAMRAWLANEPFTALPPR